MLVEKNNNKEALEKAQRQMKQLPGSFHDKLFRASMSLPEVYLPFLKRQLPEELAGHIDYDSVQVERASFIDDKLRLSVCDTVFSMNIAKKEGYICCIHEHQSRAEKLMPLRELRYKLNVLEHFAKQNQKKDKPLPLVYLAVVYHNKEQKPYRYSTDITDLIDAPRALIDRYWYKPFQLIDLTRMPDEMLLGRESQNQGIGLLYYTLKHNLEQEREAVTGLSH